LKKRSDGYTGAFIFAIALTGKVPAPLNFGGTALPPGIIHIMGIDPRSF